MNENDATEYYNAFVEMLNRKNADWVVQQVAEEVRFGKITSGEFSISKIDGAHDSYQNALFERRGDYRISKKEKLNQIVPFTPQEKLVLLIKAIRRLVIDTSNIQGHVINFAEKETKGTNIKPDIRFYSEEVNEDTFSLIASKSQINQEAVVKLEGLLSQLESEAGNDN
jgi:hypothetical protein